MKTCITIAALALVASCGASVAITQEGYVEQSCGDYEVMSSLLNTQYGEELRFQALNFEDRLISFFANSGTGKWTMLVTTTTMMACVYDAGLVYTDMEDLGDAY